MSVISRIKSDPALKKLALWTLIPANEYRPRWWVKVFLNPFKHTRRSGSVIRRPSKTDLFPFRNFELGANSVVESFSTLNNAVGDIIIGNNTFIGVGNVIIGPVSIGSNTILAQNVVLSGMNHGYEDPAVPPVKQPVSTKQIDVGDNVWIGANSCITAGVTIGKHSVIGAGSVVTKSIPEYSVAAGNPARVIKRYNFEHKKWEREG
ncbi:acyltransferase [Daejeonella sp. JGW-45]|uniref:acyltransferase n=1 Tax=Daejeonella sp. JGW-45 TaxID=3034148 RepID=UPI0023EB98A7|nr:acyltransferase [Daejeonella sp. JGW-45]